MLHSFGIQWDSLRRSPGGVSRVRRKTLRRLFSSFNTMKASNAPESAGRPARAHSPQKLGQFEKLYRVRVWLTSEPSAADSVHEHERKVAEFCNVIRPLLKELGFTVSRRTEVDEAATVAAHRASDWFKAIKDGRAA